MDDILSLMIPIVGFICLVAIVRAVVDGRLRRRLAETHASEELVRAITEADEANRKQGAQKWGLVLIMLGIALALIDVFDLGSQDPGAYGLLLAASGLGLLLHHLLQRREN